MSETTGHNLAAALAGLTSAEGLPSGFVRTVEQFYTPLAAHLAAVRNTRNQCITIGINGAQGSGKSTMAVFLKVLLEKGHQLSTVVVSLDDLYMTRAERAALAKTRHPLLATRGVPGTHDVGMGETLLKQLAGLGEGGSMAIPHFDKSTDDRTPESVWPHVQGPVDIILFEGWCVGVRPQPAADLEPAINSLEQDEDAGGIWRRYVNDMLAGPYRALFDRLDHLVMLRVPGFECVEAFRTLQESKLRTKLEREGQSPSGLMDEKALRRFIMHYERLTRHILQEMPARADVLLELDAQQTIQRMIGV